MGERQLRNGDFAIYLYPGDRKKLGIFGTDIVLAEANKNRWQSPQVPSPQSAEEPIDVWYPDPVELDSISCSWDDTETSYAAWLLLIRSNPELRHILGGGEFQRLRDVCF